MSEAFRRSEGSGTIENMAAVVWALFGVVVTTLGVLATALFTSIARTDSIRTELGARIDTLGSDLRAEIRALRGDIAAARLAADARRRLVEGSAGPFV